MHNGWQVTKVCQSKSNKICQQIEPIEIRKYHLTLPQKKNVKWYFYGNMIYLRVKMSSLFFEWHHCIMRTEISNTIKYFGFFFFFSSTFLISIEIRLTICFSFLFFRLQLFITIEAIYIHRAISSIYFKIIASSKFENILCKIGNNFYSAV